MWNSLTWIFSENSNLKPYLRIRNTKLPKSTHASVEVSIFQEFVHFFYFGFSFYWFAKMVLRVCCCHTRHAPWTCHVRTWWKKLTALVPWQCVKYSLLFWSFVLPPSSNPNSHFPATSAYRQSRLLRLNRNFNDLSINDDSIWVAETAPDLEFLRHLRAID